MKKVLFIFLAACTLWALLIWGIGSMLDSFSDAMSESRNAITELE